MVRKAIFVCTTAEDRKWNSGAEVADVRLTQTNGVLAQTQVATAFPTYNQ